MIKISYKDIERIRLESQNILNTTLFRYLAMGYVNEMEEDELGFIDFDFYEYTDAVSLNNSYFKYVNYKEGYKEEDNHIYDITKDINNVIIVDERNCTIQVSHFFKTLLEVSDKLKIWLVFDYVKASSGKDYVCRFIGFIFEISDMYKGKSELEDIEFDIDLGQDLNDIVMILRKSDDGSYFYNNGVYLKVTIDSREYSYCMIMCDKVIVTKTGIVDIDNWSLTQRGRKSYIG